MCIVQYHGTLQIFKWFKIMDDTPDISEVSTNTMLYNNKCIQNKQCYVFSCYSILHTCPSRLLKGNFGIENILDYINVE